MKIASITSPQLNFFLHNPSWMQKPSRTGEVSDFRVTLPGLPVGSTELHSPSSLTNLEMTSGKHLEMTNASELHWLCVPFALSVPSASKLCMWYWVWICLMHLCCQNSHGAEGRWLDTTEVSVTILHCAAITSPKQSFSWASSHRISRDRPAKTAVIPLYIKAHRTVIHQHASLCRISHFQISLPVL